MAFFVTQLDTYFDASTGNTASSSAKFFQFLTKEKAQAYANQLVAEQFGGPIGERQRNNPNIVIFGEGSKNCTVHYRYDTPERPEWHHKTFKVESYIVSDSNPLSFGLGDHIIPWGKTE